MNMSADTGADHSVLKFGADDNRPDLKNQIVHQEVDDGKGNVTYRRYYAPASSGDGTTININLSVGVSGNANNANAVGAVPDGVVSGSVPNVSGVGGVVSAAVARSVRAEVVAAPVKLPNNAVPLPESGGRVRSVLVPVRSVSNNVANV